MKPKSFIRKVGFGLRPVEKLPQDPLNWAKSQMKSVPKLIWPGLEQKNLFEGRDLNSSIDARAVYESILARVLESDHIKIVKDVFFNSDLPNMTKRIFL